MSFDPSAYREMSFLGTPAGARDVAWCSPLKLSPRGVPLNFNWLLYFIAAGNSPANITVPIDLKLGTVQGGLLDAIRSVKIDNTNSTISVTVFFPDTGDLVTAAPQSIVTSPVMTNAQRCFVVAQGLSAGFTPTTNVFLYNFSQPPNVDPQIQFTYPQWIGSPAIQRGNILTPGYGSPALGDQTANLNPLLNMLFPPSSSILMPAVAAGGYYYLTAFDMILSGVDSQLAANCFYDFYFEGSVSGQVYHFFVELGASVVYYNNAAISLISKSGMQLKLNASENWRVRQSIQTGNAARSGFCNAIADFSYQPPA